MTRTYFARLPFAYNRQHLDRGEILVLAGTPRDDKLIALGYFLPFDKNEHHELQCVGCGRKFINDAFHLEHKKKPGGCNGPAPEITKLETAMLLDVDVKKLQVEA